MRIGKKLFSCLSLFLLCILCLLADAPKVHAAEFLTADNGTFLYMNSRELAISDDEEGVQFFLVKRLIKFLFISLNHKLIHKVEFI